MAGRTPNSILMLIDRRSRLEGELERLTDLKRSVSELHALVQSSLTKIDKGLVELVHRYEPGRVRKVLSLKTSARGQYGSLTRMIFGALEARANVPQTTTDVFKWVLAHWPEGAARPETDPHFRVNMRRRLRSLRERGLIASPQVGRGGRSWSSWMINPEMLELDGDIVSTLLDDDSLGSTHRTTAKGHTSVSES